MDSSRSPSPNLHDVTPVHNVLAVHILALAVLVLVLAASHSPPRGLVVGSALRGVLEGGAGRAPAGREAHDAHHEMAPQTPQQRRVGTLPEF